MDNPVSVIIPTYKGSRFVERAISSILRQTYLPREIIAVDDCSPDGTAELLSAMAKHVSVPLRVIRLTKNSGGPGRPLNVGVQAAMGNVIVLLEQDDVMRPIRIEKQLAAALRFPDCSMITGRCTVIGNSDGDMKPVWPVPQFDGVVENIDAQPEFFALDPQRAFRGLLSRQIMGGHSNFCLTKRSWERLGGFNEKRRVCVDVDLALRAVLTAPVVVVNHFIMDYDCRPDSLCHEDLDSATIEVTLLRLEYASKKREWAAEKLLALQTTVLGFGRAALQRRDWTTLRQLLLPVLLYGSPISYACKRAHRVLAGAP